MTSSLLFLNINDKDLKNYNIDTGSRDSQPPDVRGQPEVKVLILGTKPEVDLLENTESPNILSVS
jgi:hypothetical protein